MHGCDRATLLMGRRIRDGKALMIIVGRIMGGCARNEVSRMETLSTDSLPLC